MTLPACQCGAKATVFIPGSARQFHTQYGPDGKPMFRTVAKEAYDTEAYCLPHAREAGWPWLESETPGAPPPTNS